MKYYTAIGIKKERKDKQFCVEIEGEEKILSEMESFIWASLLWTFQDEGNVYNRMKHMLELTFPERSEGKAGREEYLHCYMRLQARGLIISCAGETLEEAVTKIMERVVVGPAKITLKSRLNAFWDSMCHGRGIRFSLRAFYSLFPGKKDLQMLHRLLACGEITSHLSTIRERSVAMAFMPEKAGENFEKNMEKEFLEKVIALYGKKLLVIKAVREGI